MHSEQVSLHSDSNHTVTSEIINKYLEVTDSPDRALLTAKANKKSQISLKNFSSDALNPRMEECKALQEFNVLLTNLK